MSGFESLTSDDVRFLNAHRRHFDEHGKDPFETQLYTLADADLGSILNPVGALHDPKLMGKQLSVIFPTFPYLNRREIWTTLYAPELRSIFRRLVRELYVELSKYSVRHRRPTSYFEAKASVLRQLETCPAYQQIVALHMCGLGEKLIAAFRWIFEGYQSYALRLGQSSTMSTYTSHRPETDQERIH
ncbi:MAG: hypothetical protein AAFQ02_03255 [Bacteroidota bacterium]